MSAVKSIRLLAACAALGVAVTGAVAQDHQADANNAVSNQYADRQQAIAGQNDASQAQYDSDMAAYRAAVDQQHRDSMHDQAHYAHQQQAYADAMRDWRHQVWACNHGSNAACRAPTPDPAQYW
jgi:ribulose kinase